MWTTVKNSLPGLVKARTVAITMFGSNLLRVHTVLLSIAHYCYTEESLTSTTAMNTFTAHFVSSPAAGPPSFFRFWLHRWPEALFQQKQGLRYKAVLTARHIFIALWSETTYLFLKGFSFCRTSKNSSPIFQLDLPSAFTILMSYCKQLCNLVSKAVPLSTQASFWRCH